MHRLGSGGFGKFEIVCRFDLVERRLRGCRGRYRHLVGELKHLGLRHGCPYLLRSGRFIESVQQRVDVILAVGRRRCRRRRRRRCEPGLVPSLPLQLARLEWSTAECRSSRALSALAPAAAGFSGLAGGAGLEGFSAAAGFASSSAMIRRIDARISSMEGSWTFAGCVISDSTSSTRSYAFYTKRDRICRFRICGLGIFIAQARLVPRSNAAQCIARNSAPAGHRSVAA